MAKQKRKVAMPAGIRNKMMAAVSMLLVSSIMMVSSTYAWFTLSTAPEVKNISTTVAGNGSLEIALMPTSGNLTEIKAGAGNSSESDGMSIVNANTSWGNIVQLSDASYGLNNINLLPAVLETTADGGINLTTPVYGEDGRIAQTSTAKAGLGTWDADAAKFVVNDQYGVRAIGLNEGTEFSTYGYVVDLAVRLNTANGTTAGKLLLQTDAVQRISGSVNTETMGGGSYMQFAAVQPGIDLKGLLDSIRVTFVQDYGKASGTPTVVGTACLDTTNIAEGKTELTSTDKIPLKLYTITTSTSTGEDGKTTTTTTKNESTDNTLIQALTKNAATQISAIVWLDGAALTNASVAASTLQSMAGTLNLQFATDVTLTPATNTALMNPLA